MAKYDLGYKGVIEYVRDKVESELGEDGALESAPVSIAYTPASFITASRDLMDEVRNSQDKDATT